MKNFTKVLFAGALAIPTLGNAQVSTTPENRNAVIEEWTGIYCQYCPTGHAAVQTAIDNNPGDVVGINIHTGGYANPNGSDPDFRTADGDVNASGFTISGYPSSTLNRRTIGGSQTYHPANSNQPDKVPAVIAEMSEVNMDITATLDIVTRVLTVDVEYYYTANSPTATNYMYVAILQNNVEGPQTGGSTYNPSAILPNGNYNHMHMLRDFMNTAPWGDAINNTSSGSTATMSYSQTLPADIAGVDLEIADLQIAAYISSGTQSAGNILTGTDVYPTLTGFSTANEVINVGSEQANLLLCDLGSQTITPTTTLKNWGSSNLTSATITYDVDGGTPVVMNWTGSIAPGLSEDVVLDPITFNAAVGTSTLNVAITNPNGVSDNTSDNSSSVDFDVVGSTEAMTEVVTLALVTDQYGAETTWDVKDSGGATIASGGPYTNLSSAGTTAQPLVNMTLSINECYTFTINDSYGDGIDSGYGVGSFTITDGDNNVLVSGGDFLSTDLGLFKTGSDLTSNSSIAEVSFENVSIYPNPASEVLNVKFNVDAEEVSVSILDLSGRMIASENGSTAVSFNVGDLASGSYLVRISTENGSYTENVVIK